MSKYFLILTFLFSGLSATAQKQDSLFVRQYDNSFAILHTAQHGETVFSVARRYHVPPAQLAELNKVSFNQQLSANQKLYIPLGAYNLLKRPPGPNQADARPLYYKAYDYVSMHNLAQRSGVSVRNLQDWNKTSMQSLMSGQIALVGWVLYDATVPVAAAPQGPIETAKQENRQRRGIQVTESLPVSEPAPAEEQELTFGESSSLDTLSEAAKEYMQQTGNDIYIVTEKGTAAFFNGKGSNGYYYALHNIAPRGTILKIHNPGTSRTVYAKVIGKVPETRIYHNAILGLSKDARAELLVGGEKLWCEISYKQ